VKERLTGAIILVALIVLLVPELLTGPVRSAARATSVSASAEEPPLRSYTINLDDSHAHPAAAAASDPQQPAPLPASATPADTDTTNGAAPAQPRSDGSGALSTPPAAGAPSAPPPAPAPTPATRPTSHTAMTRAMSPAPSTSGPAAESGTFVVQLGSFASHDNAEHLAQQVRGQGFTVSVSQGSSGRRLYRVRVGPAHDKEAAIKLQQKLQALGHGGAVVPK
jgi:DedD protein